MINKTLLIVDDDNRIRSLLVAYLGERGFKCQQAANGEGALQKAKNLNIDLFIIDIMMPQMNGFELLAKLKEFCDRPVIMLTALNNHCDRIKGFKLGADDYVTKPFEPEELFLRTLALLKRYDTYPQRFNFQIGNFLFNTKTGVFSLKNKQIPLCEDEKTILTFLCNNSHQLVTVEQLSKNITQLDTLTNSQLQSKVEEIISKLSDKLNSQTYQEIRMIGKRYTVSAVAVDV